MAIVEVTITPLGTDSTSVSKYVAACHQVLVEENNINYQLTPMGTIIEGDLDTILQLVRKMHEMPFSQGVQRVGTHIKIDDRRDRPTSMQHKIRSVQDKL